MIGIVLACAALAVTAASAGPYDQPYALVERGEPSEVRKEAAVAITKIDGASTRDPRKSDPLTPGKHQVALHFESARGAFRPEYRVVEMDLEGCTRYRIVAKYESRLGPHWAPKVYAEPIGECRRKFAVKADAKK